MDRLTEKRYGQNVIPLRQDGKQMWSLASAGMGDASTQFLYGEFADKLAEYEDLDEQGLLLKLPCKVGDTVFLIRYGEIIPRTADMMFIGVLWDEYGKEWFLTTEEAEQKLKEMESD